MSKLARLEALDLAHNRFTDVSRLGPLERLRRLTLHHNGLVDITPLGALGRLQYLHLGHNRIRDLGPLRRARSLTVVEADGNPADADALLELPRLVRVGSTFKRDRA